MKKTSLLDLTDYLFDCLDTVSNPDLEGEELEREIRRATAITKIAQTVINNANTILDVNKTALEYGVKDYNYAADKLLGEGVGNG